MKLLNVKELAKVLNVSPGTIYYWISRDEIPYIEFGRHKRFSLEVILNHFASETEKKTLRKINVELYMPDESSFTTEYRQEQADESGAKTSSNKEDSYGNN